MQICWKNSCSLAWLSLVPGYLRQDNKLLTLTGTICSILCVCVRHMSNILSVHNVTATILFVMYPLPLHLRASPSENIWTVIHYLFWHYLGCLEIKLQMAGTSSVFIHVICLNNKPARNFNGEPRNQVPRKLSKLLAGGQISYIYISFLFNFPVKKYKFLLIKINSCQL